MSEHERQYEDGSDPQVLDIMSVPLLEAAADGYQSENWILDPERYWTLEGRATWADLASMASDEQALWPSDASDTYHGLNDRVHESGENFRDSLRLIHVEDLVLRVFAPGRDFGNPKRKVQGAFTYLGVRYRVSITDPLVVTTYLAQDDNVYEIGECYLTMSLGERYEGYCYKLIAAVITFDAA